MRRSRDTGRRRARTRSDCGHLAIFTLRGLVAELAERGVKVDHRLVWNSSHAERLTYRKTVVARERDRADIAGQRAQWTKYQGGIKPERLIFIKETWNKTNMAPFPGWPPARCQAHGQSPSWPLEDDDSPLWATI